MLANHSITVTYVLNTRRFNFTAAPLITVNYIVVHIYRLGAYPINVTARSRALHGGFRNGPRCIIGFVVFITRRLHRVVTGLNFHAVVRVIKHDSGLGVGRGIGR